VEAGSALATQGPSLTARLRELASKYGLIALLLVMPVVFGINDLVNDGNLTRLGNNLVAGLSNGSI
jgi:branched-chain amino acid transport system permease protein